MIRLKNVSKFYYNKGIITSGFTKVNLEFDVGEFVVITGESGSGKSTLLNVISGLDTYEEGEMYIENKETSHYTESDFEEYRKKYIGNIFQNFNLVNSYSVYQNIELILLINGYSKEEAKPKVEDIIKKVGLEEFTKTKVSKLSGGQKQRVAIARALAKETDIIVADEPTGNLDSVSAENVINILSEVAKDKLVIVVTHNFDQFEKHATRRIKMNDGRISEDEVLVDVIKKQPTIADKVKLNNQIDKNNRLRLGSRNAFNIVQKFLLLMVVFIFLITAVTSAFSSLKKNELDIQNSGSNIYFSNYAENRIVLNKDNKTAFTKKDINNINHLDNVESVNTNDITQDTSYYISGNAFGIDGYLHSKDELKGKVDYGRMPKKADEIALKVNSNNWFFSSAERINSCVGETVSIGDYNNDGEVVAGMEKLKVVGISIDDKMPAWESNIYVDNSLIELSKMEAIKNASSVKAKTDEQFINITSKQMELAANKKVPKGSIYTSENINGYFNDGTALNKTLDLQMKNIYDKNNIKLTVDKLFTSTNLKKTLGLEDFESNANTLFINPDDMAKLFDTGDYQLTVFVKDISKLDKTVEQLNEQGYNPMPLKGTLKTYELDEVMFQIIKVPMVMFMIVTLFFIAYFVIKLILKSRSGYFVILRILGMNRKNAKRILDIELLLDANMAFAIFLAFYAMVRFGLINIPYLISLMSTIGITEIITLYVVIMAMVYLISSKFAKGLFKKSTMNTFREEV